MMGELVSWWLVLEVLGFTALPLTVAILGNLPDRGGSLAKPLALIVAGWMIWLPLVTVTALPYSGGWILGTYAIFLLGNLALLRSVTVRARIAALWRCRAMLITSELVFTGSFALMAWLRSFTPAVVDTEKFMDVAFLSALWRAPHLPAPDPWLSGQPINYYYFGHFLLATIAKVLGTQPGTAFNLGVAAIFALAAVAVFGVAANALAAARPEGARVGVVLGGLAAVALVLVLGNLNGAQVWWQQASQLASQGIHQLSNPWAWWTQRDLWPQYQWFTPSRVIPGTIDEFPAFSFILADLHAHVLALPFDVLALAIALDLLLARGQGLAAFGAGMFRWLTLVVMAIALGGLYAINGWDLPTYLGLVLLCLGLQQLFAHGGRLSWAFVVDLATGAIMLGALAILVYAPFYAGFVSPAEGIGPVASTDRSPIGYEFAIFGLPLFILATLALARFIPWAGRTSLALAGFDEDAVDDKAALVRLVGMLAGGGILLALLCATLLTQGNLGWTLFWGVVIIGICAALVLDRLRSVPVDADVKDISLAARPELFVWCLMGTAAALVAAAEIVYLRDIFNTRMNTVFKLYYQAWLLLGIAGAIALVWLVPRMWSALAMLVVHRHTLPAGAAPLKQPELASVDALSFARRDWKDADVPAISSAEKPSTTRIFAHSGKPGAGGGLALVWLRAALACLWLAALISLTGAATAYPVLAASARTSNFTLPQGLDGTAYMATDPVNVPAGCNGYVGAGSNHNDNEGIAWLNTHISGNPVILEAPGCEWTHYSRVSSFTGLPTVLGWAGGHEGEWRMNWLVRHNAEDIFTTRLNAINTIYTSDDQQTVLNLLRQYHVKLVYVGYAERELYPNANLDHFATFLRVLYRHDGVTIYQVP